MKHGIRRMAVAGVLVAGLVGTIAPTAFAQSAVTLKGSDTTYFVMDAITRSYNINKTVNTDGDVAFNVPPLTGAVDATAALGYRHIDMISGAGHDAMHIAKVAPAGMIFVPCWKGVSHNESEDATAPLQRRSETRALSRHALLRRREVDVHDQLALRFVCRSLVDAEPDAAAICQAIAAGRVRVESRPLAWSEVFRILPDMMVTNLLYGRPSVRPLGSETAASTESTL